MHGRPFDGHTLTSALEQAERITGIRIGETFVDKGYQGAKKLLPERRIHLSGTRRGKTKVTLKKLKSRAAIEPVIGHLKSKNRLGRNFLKGINGDKLNAILAGCDRNFRKLVMLFFYFPFLYFALLNQIA